MTNPDSVTATALPEWGNIPIYRKLWLVGIINALGVALSFVNVLGSLALLLPGLILLWMGPVYKRKKSAVVLHRVRDKVTFCIILVIVLGWNLMRQGAGGDFSLSSSLPTCESRTAQSSLKDAVKNSPKARRMQLEIQEIVKAGPTSQPWLWNSQDASVKDATGVVQVYLCEAEVITNGGRQTVLYGVAWADKAKGRWVIEARF